MVKVIEQDCKNELNWTDASCENFDEVCDYHDRAGPSGPTDPLGPTFPCPILKLRRTIPPADFFTVGSMHFVSAGLRAELDRAAVECEYCEAEVRKRRGGLLGATFYLMHLLCEVDCFDFDRSEYESVDRGCVWRPRKIVLRIDAVGQAPIFTMKNAYLGFWLASNDFAAQIQATQLRGMIFTELDKVKL
jgi:hypothetical protein